MDKYFYLNSRNEQMGPVPPTEFNRYGISESTMVWRDGMSNWMRAGQVPELSLFFHQTPPPPPSGNTFGGGIGNSGTNNNSVGGVGVTPASVKPDNYMLWAVLSTLCCCFPVGVYSIILASKVNPLYEAGHYHEAQSMANNAKKWVLVSAAIGLPLQLIVFVYYFLVGYSAVQY